MIPRRRDERQGRGFERESYRQRDVAERLIDQLRQSRRAAGRSAKRAATFLARVMLAGISLWP